MPENPAIEITDGLRITICPVCRETFAIARLLFLQTTAGERQIHCPNGHAYTPNNPDVKASSNALESNIELTAALHDARRLAQSLALRLTIAGPASDRAAVADKKELKRRAKLVAVKVACAAYGRRPCPFCGNLKGDAESLAAHMQRQHPEKLAELDAAAFEPIGPGGEA